MFVALEDPEAIVWIPEEIAEGDIYILNSKAGLVHVYEQSAGDSYSRIDTIVLGSRGIGADRIQFEETVVGPLIIVTNPSFMNGAVIIIDPRENVITSNIVLENGGRVKRDADRSGANQAGNFVYFARPSDNSVIVFDPGTIDLIAAIPVGLAPVDTALNSNTNRLYVANFQDDTVSVIDTANNTVVDTIPVGHLPFGVAVNPLTNRAYVANIGDNTVSVIDGGINTVTTIELAPSTVSVGLGPRRVAVNPSVDRIYVINAAEDTVSVIEGTLAESDPDNAVVATVPVGDLPTGIAVNPVAHLIYVTNFLDGTVSVISDPPLVDVLWADNNCSQQVDPVDSLFVLRGDAGLPTNTGDCPDMGANIQVLNASPHICGDVDCNGSMTPVDSLKILRYDAGLSASQDAGCPGMGTSVTIVEG